MVVFLYLSAFASVNPVFTTRTCSAQENPASSPPLSAGETNQSAHIPMPPEKKEALVNQLNQLDERLPQLVSQKEEASNEMKRLEVEQADILDTLNNLRGYTQRLSDLVKARLVTLYKFKQMGYAISLLTAAGSNGAIRGGYTAARIMEEDQRILKVHQQKQAEIENFEKILSQMGDRFNALKFQKEAHEREILAVQEQKAELLKQVRLEEGLYAQYNTKFIESQKRLGEKAFYRKPIFDFRSKTFSTLQGTLPLPTPGKVIHTYKSGTETYTHSLYQNGIVLLAPKGQPVQAIHGGIVVYADWFKEYGKVMIIDHGDHYYSLIAHADQLHKQVGDSVEAGEKIACVGNSGSPDGAKLYFELRHYGKAVDPMEWLAVHNFSKE